MRRITKWIGISVAALFGLAVVAYIGLLFINRSDEAPSATALEFEVITAGFPKVDVSGNAFPYFVGINAPQGEDPLMQGHAWLEWSRLSLKEQWEKDQPNGKFLSTQLSGDETAYLKNLLDNCRTPSNDCLSKLNAPSDELQNELNSAQWILKRYERLFRYTTWHEPLADSYLAIPTYIDARTLNALYGLHAWQLIRKGKHQQALNALDREAGFWRMVLVNSKTLIGKMVARTVLHSNLHWTNAVLLSASSESILNVPETWQHPLSLQERDLKDTFANELQLAKVVLTQRDVSDDEISVVDRAWNKLEAPLFQPQATFNLLASRYDRISKALTVEDKKLPASVASFRQHTNETSKGGLFRLYNPIGYTVFRINASMPLVDYGLRIADLEGLRRMLLLAAKLRNEGVAAEAVSTRLNIASIRNPFTDEAFGWDDEKNAITFKGLAEDPEGSYQLPY